MGRPLLMLMLGAAACLACLCTPAQLIGQGTLDVMRREVRPPPGPAAKSDWKQRRSNSEEDERRGEFWGELLSPIATVAFYGAATVATIPYWVPHQQLHDDFGVRTHYFDYPYQYQQTGNLAINPRDLNQFRTWSLRLRGEYLDDFDDFSVIGGHALLEHSLRLGIDTEAHYRRESFGANQHDSLWTGDANVVFRFAQSPRVQMRSGIGLNWLSDETGSDFGFNFTYGGDWFICDPLISSTEVDVGTLGGAELFHFRSTLGVEWRHVEVYAGYDVYRLSGATIGGLVSGVRIWW